MFANTPQMTAGDVLNTFYRDAPYLFLGGAFVSIGLMSAAYAALRRAWDSLLIYFALFAALYGLRLWIQSRLLAVMMDGSAFYSQLRSGIDYLMLIPAFLFFTSLGLPGRLERIVGYAAAGIGGVLAVVVFSFHDSNLLHLINNVVVITGLVFLLVRSMQAGSAGNENFPAADFAVIRWGLLPFFLLALWVNLAGVLSISSPRLEPFGFAAFLASLGYVAARRALRRDQQLAEIQNELEVARRIQRSILPAEFTGSAKFQVVARYVPMTSVAGDFYDFVLADEHQAGLLIADVSGHGVPAALIASMVKLAAASQRVVAADPARLLAGMNSALLGNTQQQFVTAAYVHLDSQSRELRYSAAGHPPMLLLRNGNVMEVEENGLMLAAFDFAAYTNATHRLEPGDRLLLYTDGIVEASNASGEMFGRDSLRDTLKMTADLSPAAAADSIISSVTKWSAKQDDDLTVLVCDYVCA
jgi:sigma-B regulation protein RsbU (phosphoserine phosphatase)